MKLKFDMKANRGNEMKLCTIMKTLLLEISSIVIKIIVLAWGVKIAEKIVRWKCARDVIRRRNHDRACLSVMYT